MPTVEEVRARRDRLRNIFACDSTNEFGRQIKSLPQKDLELLGRWITETPGWTKRMTRKAALVADELARRGA
jgi:hypothetical protein